MSKLMQRTLAFALASLVSTPLLAQERVSLEAILQHADTHAPAIVVAEARRDEADAERRGAERLLSDPLRVEIAGGPRFAEATGEDFDLLLSITQPIEVAGERGARLDAAAALGARRDAELEAVRWQVHREVHFAFHEAIEARVRTESAERRHGLATRLAEIARARHGAGEIPELELAVVLAELASANEDLVRTRGAYEEARLLLAELAGWPATSPPVPLGDLDQPATVESDEALLDRAHTGHPLLRALDRAVSEREARVRVADVEAAPTLDLGLSFAREGSAGSPANYIGLLVAGVAIPLWDANGEARWAARASLAIAEAERDSLRGIVDARVLRAAVTLRTARARIEIHQRDVLPALERTVALLARAFELGEIDALEVAGATRRLLEAQASALEAFASYHHALAELEAEVGSEVIEDDAH